jgi:hypothetical protein
MKKQFTIIVLFLISAVAACDRNPSNLPRQIAPLTVLIEPNTISADVGTVLVTTWRTDGRTFQEPPFFFASDGIIGVPTEIQQGVWQAQLTDLRDASEPVLVNVSYRESTTGTTVAVTSGGCVSLDLADEQLFVNTDLGAANLPAFIYDAFGNLVPGISGISAKSNQGSVSVEEVGGGEYLVRLIDVFDYSAGVVGLTVTAPCDVVSTELPLLKGEVASYRIEEINGQQLVNTPFTVTISARDLHGNLITSARDNLRLTDTLGYIRPLTSPPLKDGVIEIEAYFVGVTAYEVITVIDSQGRQGGSNPIVVNDIPAGRITLEVDDGTIGTDDGIAVFTAEVFDSVNDMPTAGKQVEFTYNYGTMRDPVDLGNGKYQLTLIELWDSSKSPITVSAQVIETCLECTQPSASASLTLVPGTFYEYRFSSLPTMQVGVFNTSQAFLFSLEILSLLGTQNIKLSYVDPIEVDAVDAHGNILTRWTGNDFDEDNNVDVAFTDSFDGLVGLNLEDLLNIQYTNPIVASLTAGHLQIDGFLFDYAGENDHIVGLFDGDEHGMGNSFTVLDENMSDDQKFNGYLIGKAINTDTCIPLFDCSVSVEPIVAINQGEPFDLYIVPVDTSILDTRTVSERTAGLVARLTNRDGNSDALTQEWIDDWQLRSGGILGPDYVYTVIEDFVIYETDPAYRLQVFGGGSSGRSEEFEVRPADFGEIVINEIDPLQYVGTTFTLRAEALDTAGNRLTNYNLSTRIYHSDQAAAINLILPARFNNGVLEWPITIFQERLGGHLEVNNLNTGELIATSNTFDIISGDLDHFAFGFPTVQYAEIPYQITLVARDHNDITLPLFNDAISVSDLSGDFEVTDQSTWIDGYKTITLLFHGAYENNVLSISSGTVTTDSDLFDVVDIAADRLDGFEFDPIGTQRAFDDFEIVIRAVDELGATVTEYTAPVALSDLSGTLSPNISGVFVSGIATQAVSIGGLRNADRITATLDIFDPPISSVSAAFDVIASNISGFEFTVSADDKTLGEPFGITIRTVDSGDATVTGFTGTVELAVAGAYVAPFTFPCGSPTVTVSATDSTTTGDFVLGVWNGQVTVDSDSLISCAVNLSGTGADARSGQTDNPLTFNVSY